jgi:hypothetical protein
LKVTEPVGVPDPLVGVTVAVKVTGWPTVLGFCDEDSAVVVPVWPTVWLSAGEVLLLKLLSPP